MSQVSATLLGTTRGSIGSPRLLNLLSDNTGPRMQTLAVMLLNGMHDSHILGDVFKRQI